MKVPLAILLCIFAGACALGFLATFEPTERAVLWRVVYGAGVVACAACAVGLLRGGRRGSTSGGGPHRPPR